MKNSLLVLFLAVQVACLGQKTERVIVQQSDPYDLYANVDQDSLTLFYEKIIPEHTPTGVLVIIPGAGEPIREVKQQITLHTLAAQKDLLVVFPSINWGTTKHTAEHQFLDTIFKQIDQQYKIPKDRYVMGGFSGGGMLALTYAEKANQHKDSTFIVPKAIFGIDPPLDYVHLWNHCQKDVERNFSQAAVRESKWLMQRYQNEFGGSPDEVPRMYVKYSIFSCSEQDGGNAHYLKRTPSCCTRSRMSSGR